MKVKLYLIILLTITLFCASTFFLCFYVYADVYVTYDKETENIIDMSPQKDVVLEDDWEREKLKGVLTDYELQHHPRFYKYRNGKFIVNISKLSDYTISKDNQLTRDSEMKKIKEKAYLIAKKELEANGEIFTEVKDKDFE